MGSFTLTNLNFEEFKSNYRKQNGTSAIWNLDGLGFTPKLYEKTINLISGYEKTVNTKAWEIRRLAEVKQFSIQLKNS